MKTFIAKLGGPTVRTYSVFGLCMVLAVACSSSNQAQSDTRKQPPVPKARFSDLKMPDPVEPRPIAGEAALPEELRLGFALDLAGKAVSVPYEAEGRVIGISANAVTFATAKGDTGRLVFRLPKGMSLSLAAGQPIALRRIPRGYEASLGYELSMLSGDTLVVASGRIPGGSPVTVEVRKKLTLAQQKERGKVLSEGKLETIYEIPVTLTTAGRSARLAVGQPTEVVVDGRPHVAFVLESSLVVPAKDNSGLAEGTGYFLEYVVTPK